MLKRFQGPFGLITSVEQRFAAVLHLSTLNRDTLIGFFDLADGLQQGGLPFLVGIEIDRMDYGDIDRVVLKGTRIAILQRISHLDVSGFSGGMKFHPQPRDDCQFLIRLLSEGADARLVAEKFGKKRAGAAGHIQHAVAGLECEEFGDENGDFGSGTVHTIVDGPLAAVKDDAHDLGKLSGVLSDDTIRSGHSLDFEKKRERQADLGRIAEGEFQFSSEADGFLIACHEFLEKPTRLRSRLFGSILSGRGTVHEVTNR